MLSLRVDASRPLGVLAEIRLSLDDGTSSGEITIPFDSPTDPTTLKDVRWFMEDFLADLTAAGPLRAAGVRTKMLDEGRRLFDKIFAATAESAQLWQTIKPRLRETRIEVCAQTPDLAGTLWELMTPPQTGVPLCLGAASFVRIGANLQSKLGVRQLDTCRVLLITSRPAGTEDVSYRSIATKVFQALQASEHFEVTFLRPATFAHCARVLRDAIAAGHPFNIVHFDGHGLFVDRELSSTGVVETYVIFEDSAVAEGRPISGREFASLLAETGPTAVVLNACRSAHAGIPAYNTEEDQQPVTNSFSHDLIMGGVSVVVAMNYNVYVPSAARFMDQFYRQLSAGHSISVAVSLARKDMATESHRDDGLSSFYIDDWMVPVVFQVGDDLEVRRHTTSAESKPTRQATAPLGSLPPQPDLGFIGADDGILTVDRAFDQNNVVLLHGLAGAGKTATAVEFSRWYFVTGGVGERPLFTSFEEPKLIEAILADLEPLLIRQAGPDWPKMPAAQQRQLAPRLLSRIAGLWIWDNVETFDLLSSESSADLRAFLREAAAEGIKFLLTSRGSRSPHLGYLASRIELPPLRLTDSAEFAARLINRLGRRGIDRLALMELLNYCEGNPLTLTVALANLFDRHPSPTANQVSSFVNELRSGESVLDDEEPGDRSRSLTASLRYGFEALNQKILRRLALLYLFRTYANVNVLFGMFRPVQDGIFPADYDRAWTLREFEEDTPPSLDRMLQRAAEVGLLRRPKAQHFWLHPALQQHLKGYFRRFFPQQSGFERAARAYAESLGGFSILFTIAHSHGRHEDVIVALGDEHENLRRAFSLSRQFAWHQAIVGLLHGLFTLYWHTGRRGEWAQLLSEVLPEFIDHDCQALPGRERWWSFIMDQAVRLEMWRRDFSLAERYARVVLEAEERAAAPLEGIPAHLLTPAQTKQLQSVAIALSRVADILREQNHPDCLEFNERALALYSYIDDGVGRSIRLFNLGHVFKNIGELKDLQKAESYYAAAYESYPEHDEVSRSQCVAQLGSVALQHLKFELDGDRRPQMLSEYLDSALDYYQTVLQLTRADDILGLADVHNQLGVALQYLEDEQESAFEHFRLAIQFFDRAGESYEAASARNNAAQTLHTLNRLDEALVLAREALATFQSVDADAPLTIHVRHLIARIESERH